jgi:beta-phosphoglucomutase
MNKKTFIFDLDGVIIDTAKYHFLAWQRLAAQIGIDFTPEHNEQLKGVSRIKSLDLILQLGNVQATQSQKNEWLINKNTEYLSYIEEMDESEILPGVMPVLDYLKQHKHNIVLGSASKNAKLILQKAKIIDYFDAIVDGNDVSNAKPDPEVFLLGAKKVNDTPCNSIVFEDALAGIQAANLAKMISIGIGDKEVLHEADYIFNDFTFIDITFIENLINEKCV